MKEGSRYIVGIDLGTTNTALFYVDTHHPASPIHPFAIPQLVAPGRVETRPTLPSYCYLSATNEWPSGALRLPWGDERLDVVGEFAKREGARVPTRLVQSAKSWLCQNSANRYDSILPLEATDLSQRISPIAASCRYLLHLRDAWNARMGRGDAASELEEQEIILTVPASFDEVARRLTLEAAHQAGFRHLTLLEEPQAAFYSWISQHEKQLSDYFKGGETVLVCDVGGGTTDFSLIDVQSEKEGSLFFQRMAVGDHLLLGGDNIDHAIAHFLEEKFRKQGVSVLASSQWLQLCSEAREAKEQLLSYSQHHEEDNSYTITLQGHGSAVVKGSLSTQLTRYEVEALIQNGFLEMPSSPLAVQLQRSRGLRTVGLPYEDDPSLLKHLAHFLQRSHFLEKDKGIDAILFNGGTLKPQLFQHAFENALKQWFPDYPLRRLSSVSLDLAVARGAAYYGKVRRGEGVAIIGGSSRTYYLEVEVGEGDHRALTLLPRGTIEGTTFTASQQFFLRPNVPVAFHLHASHVRLHDRQEELIPIDLSEMQPLPPLHTLLRFGKKGEAEQIPVRLGMTLTAIGTLELWLESVKSSHRWQLEFDIKSNALAGGSSLKERRIEETIERDQLERAQNELQSLFSSDPPVLPGKMMEYMEQQLGRGRQEWQSSLLRGLWEALWQVHTVRKRTAAIEARWWHFAGFILRPGFGYPLDDFRIKDLWKLVLEDLKEQKQPETMIQLWICLRRVAGGLNKGQQMQVAAELLPTFFDKKKGRIIVKSKGELYPYAEKLRVVASCERLDLPLKIRLGESLLFRLIHETPLPCDYWALGRIGGRHLLYGSLGQVVPPEVCVRWIEQLLNVEPTPSQQECYTALIGQLARLTPHRSLNLPESLISLILERNSSPHMQHLLSEHPITQAEQEQLLGDHLPAGLSLMGAS